jgi:hypothetical protein
MGSSKGASSISGDASDNEEEGNCTSHLKWDFVAEWVFLSCSEFGARERCRWRCVIFLC